jgi:hypothetical protein
MVHSAATSKDGWKVVSTRLSRGSQVNRRMVAPIGVRRRKVAFDSASWRLGPILWHAADQSTAQPLGAALELLPSLRIRLGPCLHVAARRTLAGRARRRCHAACLESGYYGPATAS